MELVLNAGPVVKLVLLILVYFSVVSWAIIFYKQLVIHRAIGDSERFLEFFWSKKSFDTIGKGLDDYRHSPLTVLFREVYSELAQNRRQSEGQEDGNLVADLGEQERVARVLRRSTTSQTQRLEKYLSFLATTGSAAPFIGLFGTVWGIMNAFVEIAAQQNTNLAVVAPGIAEALLATGLGLLAAIPAVVFYNHLSAGCDRVIAGYEAFADEFATILSRQLGG